MKGSVPGNINTFHIITSQTPKFHNYTWDLEGGMLESSAVKWFQMNGYKIEFVFKVQNTNSVIMRARASLFYIIGIF